MSQSIKLQDLFYEINDQHFDGFLDFPRLVWNSRLRTSAGRFFPGVRLWLEQPWDVPEQHYPRIEVAAYLLEQENARAYVYDTMGHEMIHFWLWVRRKPYGHTPEFMQKMKQMGVSRYNTVPKTGSVKYIYKCNSCQKTFPAKRKLGPIACRQCCETYAQGLYDPRFRIELCEAL